MKRLHRAGLVPALTLTAVLGLSGCGLSFGGDEPYAKDDSGGGSSSPAYQGSENSPGASDGGGESPSASPTESESPSPEASESPSASKKPFQPAPSSTTDSPQQAAPTQPAQPAPAPTNGAPMDEDVSADDDGGPGSGPYHSQFNESDSDFIDAPVTAPEGLPPEMVKGYRKLKSPPSGAWAEDHMQPWITYDTASDLSWVQVISTDKKYSQILLFHKGKYIGVTTGKAQPGHQTVTRMSNSSILVIYRTDRGNYQVTYTWQPGNKKEPVRMDGDAPVMN